MSIIVNKLTFAMPKSVVEAMNKIEKRNDKVVFLNNVLAKMSIVEKPVQVERKLDTEAPLSDSRFARLIGAENMAVLNLGNVFCYMFNKVEKNYLGQLKDEEQDFVEENFSKVVGRLFKFGAVDNNGQVWKPVCQTNKQAQDNNYLFVKEGLENKDVLSMGFNFRKEEAYSLEGAQVDRLRKIRGMLLSEQHPFSEMGLPKICVENVRILSVFNHEFHVRRVSNMWREGGAARHSSAKWDKVTTAPCDAVMVFVEETFAYIALKEQYGKEEAYRIAVGGYYNTLSSESDKAAYAAAQAKADKWSKKGVQGRGPAMKYFGLTAKVLKMRNAILEKEGCESGNLILVDGSTIELSLESLLKNEVYALGSLDVMKYTVKVNGKKSVPVEYFTGYSARVKKEFGEDLSSELEAVEVVDSSENVLSKYVTVSRQLTSAMQALDDEDAAAFCRHSMEELADLKTRTAEELNSITLYETVFGQALLEDSVQAARRKMLFSKVLVKGSFAFACTELRPFIANAMGFNYRNHMTLHGAECQLKSFEEYKVCTLQRYPSLANGHCDLRIVEGTDEYCSNVCVLSYDTLFNVTLKGDFDGDHPLVTLPETKAAGEYFAKHYDFDELYLPDAKDGVSLRQLLEAQEVEQTVSVKRLQRLFAHC